MRLHAAVVAQAALARDNTGALYLSAETAQQADAVFVWITADFYVYHCGEYSSTGFFAAQAILIAHK